MNYDDTWLEGFYKAAQATGMDAEATAVLLKVGSAMALLEQDPQFTAGFEAELQKNAINIPAMDLLRYLARHALPFGAGAAAVGLGIPAISAAKDKIMLSPAQRAQLDQFEGLSDLVRSGTPQHELDMIGASAAGAGYSRLKNNLKQMEALGVGGRQKSDYTPPAWY